MYVQNDTNNSFLNALHNLNSRGSSKVWHIFEWIPWGFPEIICYYKRPQGLSLYLSGFPGDSLGLSVTIKDPRGYPCSSEL